MWLLLQVGRQVGYLHVQIFDFARPVEYKRSMKIIKYDEAYNTLKPPGSWRELEWEFFRNQVLNCCI